MDCFSDCWFEGVDYFEMGVNFLLCKTVNLSASKLWHCPKLHYQMGVTGFDSGLRACV